MKDNGFTLIEMAIAMAVSMIVMAGVYGMHRTMVRGSRTVEEIAGMDQNMRAGVYRLTRELRQVGANPTGRAYNGTISLPFISTAPDAIRFSMDVDDTGSVTGQADGLLDADGEVVGYALEDRDSDGDTDLVRGDINGTNIVAENIDALNFVYLDQEGAITADSESIRSVQMTLVGRTAAPSPFSGYLDDSVYTNLQDEVIYTPGTGDNHRRIRLAFEVVCRNTGVDKRRDD